MRIAVIGAGAIGGLLAVRLAEAGAEVSVVARGAHLAAIVERGLTLVEADGSRTTRKLRATNSMAALGPQDLVVLGMKAHQVADVVDDLPALFDKATMVLAAQNGIPWWYFERLGGPYAGRRLESVDPGGRVADRLPVGRVVGCVVYPAGEIVAPGVIRHIEGERFSLSEIDGAKTERVARLSELMTAAGFKAPVVADIRAEIWTKLWGNMSFNPISALTHATLEAICDFPLTRALAASIMREAQSVGEALGVRFRIPIDKRIAGAREVGAHKTSMLQDVEAGRALEAQALIGSVVELGAMTGVATPATEAVYACVMLLNRTLADARGRLRVEPAS